MRHCQLRSHARILLSHHFPTHNPCQGLPPHPWQNNFCLLFFPKIHATSTGLPTSTHSFSQIGSGRAIVKKKKRRNRGKRLRAVVTDSLRTHCSLKILHLLPKTGTSKEGHGAQSCATHPHPRLGIWPRPHWVQSPKDDFVQSTRHRRPGIPNQRRIGSFVSSPQSTAAAPPPRTLQRLTAAFRRGKSVLEIKNQTQAVPNDLCHPIQSPGALQSSRGFAALLPWKAAAETPQRVAWVGTGGAVNPAPPNTPRNGSKRLPHSLQAQGGESFLPCAFLPPGNPAFGEGMRGGGWMKPLQSGRCNGFLGARLDGGGLLPAGYPLPLACRVWGAPACPLSEYPINGCPVNGSSAHTS